MVWDTIYSASLEPVNLMLVSPHQFQPDTFSPPPPVLTPCQQRREKEQLAAELYKRVAFIPKCDRRTGAWEPVQCQPEFGLCWCVDSNGTRIEGTMVAGVPSCSSRQGRRLSLLPRRTQSECRGGHWSYVT